MVRHQRGLAMSQPRADSSDGLGRRHDWYYFKVHQISPFRHPLVEQVPVVTFHDLEAPLEIMGDPAGDVAQAVRGEPALIAESSIDGNGIPSTKMLGHHVEHCSSDWGQ